MKRKIKKTTRIPCNKEKSMKTPHSKVPILGQGFEPGTFHAPLNIKVESRLMRKNEKVLTLFFSMNWR